MQVHLNSKCRFSVYRQIHMSGVRTLHHSQDVLKKMKGQRVKRKMIAIKLLSGIPFCRVQMFTYTRRLDFGVRGLRWWGFALCLEWFCGNVYSKTRAVFSFYSVDDWFSRISTKKWPMGVPRSCSECLSLKRNLEKPEFLGKASSKFKLQFRYFRQFQCGIAGFYFFLRHSAV